MLAYEKYDNFRKNSLIANMKEDVHRIMASYQRFFGTSMTTGYFSFKLGHYY